MPTLCALLDAPASRPKTFYRGNGVYDQKNGGFVSTVASENGNGFSRCDTSRQGNDNGDPLRTSAPHGTELTSAEKDALVEYMKTL